MIRDWNNTASQFLRFCVVGVGNTCIDFSIYLALTRVTGLYFLFANIISVGVAMLFSFCVNKSWTFRYTGGGLLATFTKFGLVNLGYYIINNGGLYLLVHFNVLGDISAKICMLILGLFFNFSAQKFWTFAPR